ncbi:flagellin [Brevundimonas nasdae]|uniref:Flagellin n=1 Tax=Brevundimonas nasdae TaxID=172043 RepID=A0ABX8TFY7_9CAUL|nr:flagellin [Brevundimonas nasdae]MBK6025062.1 flagellin [Brevundimonas nasdae]MDQ0451604.1 flagellin [Brevundimonas nasdae]QYC08835.1 flagellin [Brevundimonas nasdae]QYC14884.1 flagellin [Brevundimonas nasdae]
MANSINTNGGALVALQTLNATNKALETTQNRVNTGLKVSSAKDNGAIFAIATSQRAEMGAQDAVRQSLQRGQSIVDVALAAGDTVTSALKELKGLAVSIQDDAGDGAGGFSENGKKLVADFESIMKEVHSALGGAKFDGVNLFAANTNAIQVTTNTSGGKFDLKAAAGAATGASLLLGGTAANDVWSAAATDAAKKTAYTAANVDTAINSFASTLADLGTKSKSLDRQATFVSKLQDSLETGIGNLVDADLAKESARLTALQTKQQLGVQALSIANSSSSILLGLFR